MTNPDNILIMPESSGNLLCLKAGERVTLNDYQNVILPKIQAILAEHGTLNLLIAYNLDHKFLGWDIDAAAKDIETVTELGKRVNKVALLNPPSPAEQRWGILKPLIKGEVRSFDNVSIEVAMDWLQS